MPKKPAPDPETTLRSEASRPGAAGLANARAVTGDSSLKSLSAVVEAVPRPTVPVRVDLDDSEGEAAPAPRRFLLAAVPGWLLSMFLHLAVILVLALLSLPNPIRERVTDLVMGNAEQPEVTADPIIDAPRPSELNQPSEEVTSLTTTEQVVPTDSTAELVATDPQQFEANDPDMAQATTDLDPLGPDLGPKKDLMKRLGTFSGAGLEGRGKAARATLLREGGGTEGSERAVQAALKWIQRHQNPDGSWSFQHLGGRCECGDPGSLDMAYNGATAMALLPYLGAGNTHREGQYQREVQAGLYYLLSHQKPDGSFAEAGGNLYSHGLSAIVLSEAYAMTQDKALARPAQAALDYIAFAQDPVGGGWRYGVKQPGDTSVVGWQLMALKSGRMAYLHVDQQVFAGASRFLDSVQTDSGAAYGYSDPGDRPSTSAIGLLCRMYLGWERDEAALLRGIERLGKSGPSDVDMYYNYYATQVMRHIEGPAWEKWNEAMRESLIKSQAKNGHEEGSWYMGNNHSSQSGGRLYCTSMATMILEVYYRHLPLYRQAATEDDFEF